MVDKSRRKKVQQWEL